MSRILLQSAGGPRLVPFLRTFDAPKVPLRFYLDMGLYEEGIWASLPPDARAPSASGLLLSRHLRDVLQAKGYDVMYHETGSAHEFVHWRATLAEGLMALLGPPTK